MIPLESRRRFEAYYNAQVAFISQEAREKAREVQVKADEEFAIEKVCCTFAALVDLTC